MDREFEFLLYKSTEEDISVNALVKDETIWLNQKAMAELFGCSTDNISQHLKNIFADGELRESATTEKISVVQTEGNRQVKGNTQFYNLDAIISVGYRVNSHRATKFRIWATNILKEYMIKGFAITNNERLKQYKTELDKNYLEELDIQLNAKLNESVAREQVLHEEIDKISLEYPSIEGFENKLIFQKCNSSHFIMDLIQKIFYTITDLNNEISNLDTPTNKSIIYVITLVDWIMHAVRILIDTVPLDIIKSFSFDKDSYVKQAQRYISAIRSFAVAHPLETNRHKNYGFDGNTICVDIRPNSNLSIMPNERCFYIDFTGKHPWSNEYKGDYCFYVYSKNDKYECFYALECSFFDLYTAAQLFINKLDAVSHYLSQQKIYGDK